MPVPRSSTLSPGCKQVVQILEISFSVAYSPCKQLKLVFNKLLVHRKNIVPDTVVGIRGFVKRRLQNRTWYGNGQTVLLFALSYKYTSNFLFVCFEYLFQSDTRIITHSLRRDWCRIPLPNEVSIVRGWTIRQRPRCRGDQCQSWWTGYVDEIRSECASAPRKRIHPPLAWRNTGDYLPSCDSYDQYDRCFAGHKVYWKPDCAMWQLWTTLP